MAVRFDASGEELIRTGGLGLTSDTLPLTVCGWFKRVADTNTFTNPLNIDNNGAGTEGEQISSDSGGDTPTATSNNGQGVINGPAWVNDAWVFLAITIQSGTNGRTFWSKADGAGSMTNHGSTTPTAGQHDNLTQLWLGDGPFNEFFNGSICCPRLWNAVLSEADLLAESESATPVRATNLQGAWRLETTSDVTDVSGNGRDLTGGTGATTDVDEPADIAASGPPPQLAAPIADAHIGSGWVTDTGATSNLFAAIDETTASDSDYVRSPTDPTASVYVCQLGSLADPAVSTGHVVRYRYEDEGDAAIDLTVQLRQGYVSEASQGTLIDEWVHNDISATVVQANQTLGATEADSISDYSDLYLRFVANMP